MTRDACKAYGYELSQKVEDEFQYRTTHNDGVFRVYNKETKAARHCGLITGLPDAYGRGRIIGDYRRVALYGIDRLIEEKQKDKDALSLELMDVDHIRQLEELYQQINFLGKLRDMAALYGFDITKPAGTAQEAVQWLYFRIPGIDQGTKRRCDEPRTRLHLPGYLFRARYGCRSPDRGTGTGADG